MPSIHKHKHNLRYKPKSINVNKLSTYNNNNNDRTIRYNDNHNNKHIPNPSSDTLYNALSKSKNDLYTKFNPHKSNHFPLHTSKPAVIECFKLNPPSNVFRSHEMYMKVIHNQDTKVPMLSERDIMSSTSEKDRFQRFYSELFRLKNYIEANKPKAKSIITDFLMDNAIYNPKYYTEDKIENFMTFLSADEIIIDQQKLFKDILKEILKKGYCSCNKTNITYYNKDNNNNTHKLMLKTINNKYNYRNKNCLSVDIKPKIDLVNDMELQKSLYEKKAQIKHQIDLHKRPTLVINLLKDDFIERPRYKIKGRPKNLDWNNERLYGNKKISIDYNLLKKENKITDYVCLLKARNNYNLTQMEGDFFIKGRNYKNKNKNNNNLLIKHNTYV
jgi:hypothetical protein